MGRMGADGREWVRVIADRRCGGRMLWDWVANPVSMERVPGAWALGRWRRGLVGRRGLGPVAPGELDEALRLAVLAQGDRCAGVLGGWASGGWALRRARDSPPYRSCGLRPVGGLWGWGGLG